MTDRSISVDDPFDAVALAEAHLRDDPEAWDVVSDNCDLVGVVAVLVLFLDAALVEHRHLTPPEFLADMRARFTSAFRDETA